MNGRYMKEYSTKNHPYPFRMPLPNGFTYHTEITLNGFVHPNADRYGFADESWRLKKYLFDFFSFRFHINLLCGHNDNVALHFNPRFKDRNIVRNSLIGGEWGPEERDGRFDIAEKKDFTLTITCMEKKFKVIGQESLLMIW